jgi:hypothetical protein
VKILNKKHRPKNLLLILLSFVLFCCEDKNDDILNDNESEGLVINEFLAKNSACCTDENGEYDDWVEIYNGTDAPVNIGGMYFSDRRDDPAPYKIPNTDASITTVPIGGFLVLWCDGQPEQGILHVDLKLSGDGESVVLIDKDGTTVIDFYTFGAQTSNISMGRSGNDWIFFEHPTPGSSNN